MVEWNQERGCLIRYVRADRCDDYRRESLVRKQRIKSREHERLSSACHVRELKTFLLFTWTHLNVRFDQLAGYLPVINKLSYFQRFAWKSLNQSHDGLWLSLHQEPQSHRRSSVSLCWRRSDTSSSRWHTAEWTHDQWMQPNRTHWQSDTHWQRFPSRVWCSRIISSVQRVCEGCRLWHQRSYPEQLQLKLKYEGLKINKEL